MAIVIMAGSSGRTVPPQPFATEDEFQVLLANSPQLLREDADAPLALVAREVDLHEAGYLDLLLVSGDGLPVAVEVKLERNDQARREVVAQVIDYLSALTTLTVDELDERVEGKLEAALRTFSSPGDDDETEFERRWRAVGANLRAGLARLVVALDGAPPGLERIFRFLARNSDLDVRLLVVQRHNAGPVGDICVSNVLVSPSSDETRPQSTLDRTPRPELIAAANAFNASNKSGLMAVGAGVNYRQIRPPDWPAGFRTHYEFYQTKSILGAELHIETDAARSLGEELAPLAGTQVAAGAASLVWDGNWSSGRGRLAAQFPPEVEPHHVAAAMEDLIALTRDKVRRRLSELHQARPAP